MTQVNTKNVGLFLVLPAPLNPIGAFDAESFKNQFRSLVDENEEIQFVAVDLSGLDFVYSDAYNAFMQVHQELSNRNGLFAVLADKESLANSLKKVGLERFIRIFRSHEDMAAYVRMDAPKLTRNPPKTGRDSNLKAQIASVIAPAQETKAVPAKPKPAPAVEPKVTNNAPLADRAPVVEKKPVVESSPVAEKKPPVNNAPLLNKNPLVDDDDSFMGKNPLVDEEPSSKGTVVAAIVLLLLAIAAVAYFFM